MGRVLICRWFLRRKFNSVHGILLYNLSDIFQSIHKISYFNCQSTFGETPYIICKVQLLALFKVATNKIYPISDKIICERRT